MLAQVKKLLYWKTEHGSASNCQDAPSYNDEQGLFAVADGAGTSLFPALWAGILAQHFVTTPLMSNDPFEVEWWVRMAQTEYKQQMPDMHKAGAWNVVQKVRNQGSDSTLATLRITKVDTTTAEAMLLVFGDSCVLIGDPGQQTVSSFILQKPSEFDRAPICVPSDLKYFNRDFHRCQIKNITINAGDQIILATDAVSRWILGHGETTDIWDAFQEVYQCPSLDDWYTLVDTKRQCKEMINDDSTALILTFYEDGATTDTQPDLVPLGCVNKHTPEVITQRQKAFEEAASCNNKELLAIAYGDGNDLCSATTTPPVDDIDIRHAREVADGLKEVLRVFRLAQNSPDLVQKVRPMWEKYGQLLENEPCAANLRETLHNNGIIRPTPAPLPIVPPKYTSAPAFAGWQAQVPAARPIQTPMSVIPPTQTPTPAQDRQNFDIEQAQTIHVPRQTSVPMPAVNTPTQQKQLDLELELAKKQREVKFLRACEKDNEEEIVATYEELLKHNDQDTLAHIGLARQLLIDEMRQRRTALTNFATVMQQHTNPDKILSAYHAAREVEPSLPLSQQEQEIITLAQAFMAAWHSHDPYALEKAYSNIHRSRFSAQIVFTPEEAEKYVQVSKFVQRQKEDLQRIIVGKVGPQIIPLRSFIGIYIIKSLYTRYLESQLPSNIQAEATEQGRVINTLRQQAAADDFPLLVFDELINSFLIRIGIHALGSDSPLEQQLHARRHQLVDELQWFEENRPDPLFRRHELGREDLMNFSRVVIAPEIFASYLENQKKAPLLRRSQPKKGALDDWLRERKEEYKDTIFFGETECYAYADRTRVQNELKKYVAIYLYTSSYEESKHYQ